MVHCRFRSEDVPYSLYQEVWLAGILRLGAKAEKALIGQDRTMSTFLIRMKSAVGRIGQICLHLRGHSDTKPTQTITAHLFTFG